MATGVNNFTRRRSTTTYFYSGFNNWQPATRQILFLICSEVGWLRFILRVDWGVCWCKTLGDTESRLVSRFTKRWKSISSSKSDCKLSSISKIFSNPNVCNVKLYLTNSHKQRRWLWTWLCMRNKKMLLSGLLVFC